MQCESTNKTQQLLGNTLHFQAELDIFKHFTNIDVPANLVDFALHTVGALNLATLILGLCNSFPNNSYNPKR